VTLQLHRPDGKGGLEPRSVTPPDWRTELQSPRWRPARLKNVEMNPTTPGRAALFWLGLGLLTFVLLVAGYGSGFWR
jgi:hypothetical protein